MLFARQISPLLLPSFLIGRKQEIILTSRADNCGEYSAHAYFHGYPVYEILMQTAEAVHTCITLWKLR